MKKQIEEKHIKWIESRIKEVITETGFGLVNGTWHIRNGRVEWVGKSYQIMDKELKKSTSNNRHESM